MKKPRIVIYVDGGLVQWVATNSEDMEILILDGDTNGADESELSPFTFKDGVENVFYNPVRNTLVDSEYVKSLFNEIPKE